MSSKSFSILFTFRVQKRFNFRGPMLLNRVEGAFKKYRFIWKTDFVKALNEGFDRFRVLGPAGESLSIGIKKINEFAAASGKKWMSTLRGLGKLLWAREPEFPTFLVQTIFLGFVHKRKIKN